MKLKFYVDINYYPQPWKLRPQVDLAGQPVLCNVWGDPQGLSELSVGQVVDHELEEEELRRGER